MSVFNLFKAMNKLISLKKKCYTILSLFKNLNFKKPIEYFVGRFQTGIRHKERISGSNLGVDTIYY